MTLTSAVKRTPLATPHVMLVVDQTGSTGCLPTLCPSRSSCLSPRPFQGGGGVTSAKGCSRRCRRGGRRRRGWRCGVAFPRTWHSCLRRSEMNVSVVILVAVVGAAALCAPVDGAAYAWPFAPDQNKSNVATPSASPPSASAPTTTVTGPRQPTPEEREDCQSQIGKIEEGVHISTMRKYDMAKILEEHGGAPGKLNEPLDMDVPEFPVADPTLKPLPDTGNTTFWVYDYK
ncbi:uncharacterized protein LOC113214079 isoform X2 [Frankliniella occidentalis]|uniref:Uncharacterized protein LOC113214079 isoform X2 n=1 Tax=Frankliniella occidentalis TaxID=133901 RepID=A0A9C6XWC8_FRAOC|nr:uncharacterized protein LOC113214079 isoform X2 [Frankliniella occidentalis]